MKARVEIRAGLAPVADWARQQAEEWIDGLVVLSLRDHAGGSEARSRAFGSTDHLIICAAELLSRVRAKIHDGERCSFSLGEINGALAALGAERTEAMQ